MLLHPPGTLYLLIFDCAKTFSLSTSLENPSVLTHLVLLCCIKRLCIFGPKGGIQICIRAPRYMHASRDNKFDSIYHQHW